MPRTTISADEFKQRARQAEEHSLEDEFAARWRRLYPDLNFAREHQLVTGRAFRGDFCWPDKKVCVEIQGGIWAQGRNGHSTGQGIERDATKTCLASLGGWVVFPLTEAMMRDRKLLDGIADFIRGRP